MFGCDGFSLLCVGFRLSLVSEDRSSLRCESFSLSDFLLQSMVSRSWGCVLVQYAGSVVEAQALYSAGSVLMAYGLSDSEACGIFPN